MLQNPSDALETVHDAASFVEFVRVLGEDFASESAKEGDPASYSPGANGWENDTIDAFLGAASAWAQDQAGVDPSQYGNPWRYCAQVLYMGKIYE
jgi:hypothetical protein